MDKHKNKTGGRTKGTPNKVTTELRTRIQTFLDEKLEDVILAFEDLEPKDKFNYYIKLIEYVLPKQRQIEDTTLAQLYAMTPEQRATRIKEIENILSNE